MYTHVERYIQIIIIIITESLVHTKKQIDILIVLQLVHWRGLEVDRHLLRCLISYVDFSAGEPSEPSAKDYFQAQLLKHECVNLLCKPSFISNLCFAIDRPFHHQKVKENVNLLLILRIPAHINRNYINLYFFFFLFQSLNPSTKFFVNLKKTLGLSLVQEVAFAIALQHSENIEIRNLALEHTQKQLPELIKNYVNSETNNKHHEEGLHDSSPEILHLILTQIFHNTESNSLSAEAKETFLKNLRRDFPRELVPVVLAPLLYPGDGEISQTRTELNMAVNQMVRHYELESCPSSVAQF